MSRKLTKIKHFRLFSTVTSSSSIPKVAVVERFNSNYSEKIILLKVYIEVKCE